MKREIVIVLAVKACIVLAAAFFVFGPLQRPHIDTEAARTQMLSPLPHPDHGADQ